MTETKKEQFITELEKVKARIDEIVENLILNAEELTEVDIKAEIQEMLRDSKKAIKDIKSENEEIISNCLKKFQIYPNTKEYDYFLTAIEICIKEPSYIHNITKLYSVVANNFHTTVKSIEHKLQDVISQKFSEANKEFRDEFFMGREKVTISEFISVITEFIVGDDNEIGGILQKLGIMPNYHGYDYLKAAIETGIQNPNLLLKDVYAKVAKEFDVSVYSVDQNIKIAIKSSNSKRNHDFFIKLFKEDITPTSKKFIFTVAGYIKVNRILSNNRHHQL